MNNFTRHLLPAQPNTPPNFDNFAIECVKHILHIFTDKLEPFNLLPRHRKHVEDCRTLLKQAENLTEEQFDTQTRHLLGLTERVNLSYEEDHKKQEAVLATARERVNAWNPPTPQHQCLKDFMLDQLVIKKHFRLQPTEEPAFETYKTRLVQARREHLEQAELELEKAISHYESDKKWIEEFLANKPGEYHENLHQP
jgi:hypothetical protein